MKRTRKKKMMVALAICLVMLLEPIMSPVTLDVKAASYGVNSEDADLTISSVEEFKAFAESVNAGDDYTGKVIQLTADLDFGSQAINNFTTPIGTWKYPFSGTFDGRNHTITGINFINMDTKENIGVFDNISSSGVVKNLVLEDISLEGYGYMGGVAVSNDGLVKNVTLLNSQLTGNDETCAIGGIVAENEGVVDDCHVKNTNISNCYDIGGIVTTNYKTGTIKNCSADGVFQASILNNEHSRAGGIVAVNWHHIYNCCSMARLETVCETGTLGGIAGDVTEDAIIQNCYNVGELSGQGMIGGIASFIGEKCIVANCYSLEDVAGSLFGEIQGIDKNNKMLSQTEMQSDEFKELLNTNRGSNTDWLQWEIRSESKYPLPVQWTDLSRCEVVLDNTSFTYTKNVITPSFKITDEGVELQENKDYSVSYENNKNVGTGKIIITGIGAYGGTIEKTFTIKKANQKINYKSSYSKSYKSKAFTVYAKRTVGDGKLTYKSSNKKVATVNSKGKVTIKKAGKTVITVTAAGTANYNKKSVKITIQVAAKKKTIERPGGICKSGKYLYYSYDNTGIIRYNPKTGKKKKIRDIKIGKKQGRYFESLSIKGNYIYASWDEQAGSYQHKHYICRISKDGKKVKKLARGYKPVVIGNYIYYLKTKYNASNGNDKSTNVIVRMKLDGSSKKVVTKIAQSKEVSGLYRYGSQVVYGVTVNDKEVYYSKNGTKLDQNSIVCKGNISGKDASGYTTGGYRYYTNANASNGYERYYLYRENVKTGKVSEIFAVNPEEGYSERIVSYYVTGDYILIETFYTHLAFQVDITKVYCIKKNGKTKKILGEYSNFNG